MPSPEIMFAFFGAAILLAIAPGPDNIFVLAQSALFGTRAGISTTLGLISGLIAHTLAVALGVAALVMAWPLAFTILKCIGAAYLLWLAWLSFRAKPAVSENTGTSVFPGYAALYRRGVIMNVTNPKVVLFFLAFLPQFCRPDSGPMAVQIIIFGLLFMLASLIVFCAVSMLGGRLATRFNKSPGAQIIVHRIAAIVFVGLAVALFMADATGSGA